MNRSSSSITICRACRARATRMSREISRPPGSRIRTAIFFISTINSSRLPQDRGKIEMASVRYIVADVDKAVVFYRDNLDFRIDKHNPGKFAALLRDDLTLYLSAPGAGSGGQAGGDPKPG